ncbi:unnamed protein product [Prorocentrum cordatum]|uniref:C2 domain-containing protein n=1 Tax=Prorocentrum cordatum TaxID=2364126 RepID=A0ABN9UG57_9DINO|nr:unnamed protein product [Polarella glacialis]
MFGGKSDPYCICMLAEAKQAKKLFQTKVVDNDPDPDWNHGPEQVDLGSGQGELLFEIYDKDFCRKGDKLGAATVSMERCLQGLYTDLDLGDGVGTLRVKIAPVGPSGAPVEVRWTPPQVRPRLQVWVDRAEGLRSADAFGGKSDPYVICSLSEKKAFRTRVIHDDNDPVWDHGPEELVLGSETELRFEVRDRDVLGSDFLGKAVLPRAQCVSGFAGRLDLGAGCGILHVRVELAPSGPEPPPARLEVTILSAKALRSGSWFMGSSDSYAVCKLRGKPLFQTKAIWSELSPSWDHGPVEVAMRHSERELRFEVYHSSTLGRDTLLGRCSVAREACLAGFEGDVDLGSGGGSLRLRVVPVAAGTVSAAAAAALQAQPAPAVPLSPGTTAATDAVSNPTGLNTPGAAGTRPRTAVWVYGAKGLRNADLLGGKSDPYCVCKVVEDQLSQHAFQTGVINNDPNPQWNHGPEEVSWAEHQELVFEVFDKDMLRTGDKLGEVHLNWKQCAQGLHEDLSLGEGNGTLRVKIAPVALQSQPATFGRAPELVAADVPRGGEAVDTSSAIGS